MQALPPGGIVKYKPMGPTTKQFIVWMRKVQLGLRVLELVGGIGLLGLMILITKVDSLTSWVLRITVSRLSTSYYFPLIAQLANNKLTGWCGCIMLRLRYLASFSAFFRSFSSSFSLFTFLPAFFSPPSRPGADWPTASLFASPTIASLVSLSREGGAAVVGPVCSPATLWEAPLRAMIEDEKLRRV